MSISPVFQIQFRHPSNITFLPYTQQSRKLKFKEHILTKPAMQWLSGVVLQRGVNFPNRIRVNFPEKHSLIDGWLSQ
jgi:hypothetical protein